jgi:hypothetical protein
MREHRVHIESSWRLAAAAAVAVAASAAVGACAEGAPAGPAAAPRVLVVEAAGAGALYLRGERLSPPYRIAAAAGRVLINDIDAGPPAEAPDAAAALPTDAAAALPEICAMSARAGALVDSLHRTGAPAARIAGRALALLRESALVEDARVVSTDAIEVAWRGVPGRQRVPLSMPCRPPLAQADPVGASLAFQEWLVASLSRGELFASGVGYHVSLAGALADSMEAAIARFRASPAETLAVSRRTYLAFGRDLRAAWRREAPR